MTIINLDNADKTETIYEVYKSQIYVLLAAIAAIALVAARLGNSWRLLSPRRNAYVVADRPRSQG